MYWNRFDIVEAWYLALSHCHSGQWSEEYKRLCRMQRYFKPGQCLCVENLGINSKEIYDNTYKKLLAKHGR